MSDKGKIVQPGMPFNMDYFLPADGSKMSPSQHIRFANALFSMPLNFWRWKEVQGDVEGWLAYWDNSLVIQSNGKVRKPEGYDEIYDFPPMTDAMLQEMIKPSRRPQPVFVVPKDKEENSDSQDKGKSEESMFAKFIKKKDKHDLIGSVVDRGVQAINQKLEERIKEGKTGLHAKEVFLCDKCQNSFTSIQDFHRHRWCSHRIGVPPPGWTEEGLGLVTNEGAAAAAPVKWFSCRNGGCSEKFSSSSSRLRHEKHHCSKGERRKSKLCPFCTDSFFTMQHLKRHVNAKHPSEFEEWSQKVSAAKI